MTLRDTSAIEPPPGLDHFYSDWESALYVACKSRSRALTFGAAEMGEPRCECRVCRVWMKELQGEEALEVSGEYEVYFLEVERGTDGAFPMWKVEWVPG